MDSGKIIGSGIVMASVIALNGLINSEPIARPEIGVFAATFLLAAMHTAGLAKIADNLALLTAGTIVVIYGNKILREYNRL